MKKILSFALVALVCAAFTSCKKSADSNPGDVALKGYKAMMEGKDFTQYVSPNTDTKLIEECKQEVKESLQYMKDSDVSLKDIKLVSVEEDGDEATATISQTFVGSDKESTNTIDMNLEKVDDVWYLNIGSLVSR